MTNRMGETVGLFVDGELISAIVIPSGAERIQICGFGSLDQAISACALIRTGGDPLATTDEVRRILGDPE
jgi:hypothetical protein